MGWQGGAVTHGQGFIPLAQGSVHHSHQADAADDPLPAPLGDALKDGLQHPAGVWVVLQKGHKRAAIQSDAAAGSQLPGLEAGFCRGSPRHPLWCAALLGTALEAQQVLHRLLAAGATRRVLQGNDRRQILAVALDHQPLTL